MKKFLHPIFCFCLLLATAPGFGQTYLDEFDNDDPAFMDGAAAYSFSEANSELTITGDGNAGPWDVFVYKPHDPSAGTETVVDATSTNKIFIRAKASNVGTQLRLDLQDVGGFATSQAGITKTLTTEFMVLEFDFTGNFIDGGFGGTSCTTGPCNVDATMIQQLVFFINPGAGGFGGTVVIDYIAFGEEPDPVITSDIYQDHFEQDSSVNNFTFIGAGYTVDVDTDNSEVNITGDGTIAMWDPLTYIFRNPNTLDTIDIDVSENNKLYIKAKSTVEGTALRLDLQDIDGFVTTEGSITKILDTEYKVFEYDYSGVLRDLGFGGTPCTESTAPCPVNPMRIADIVMFIEPGVGEFLGTVSIDYISFGKSLDPPAPPGVTVYGDHFNNGTTNSVTDPFGLVSTEEGSDWTITGDGTATPFSALAYGLNDQSTGESIVLDATGNNLLYIRAKSTVEGVPLRIDLVDTLDFVTSQPSLTKVLGTEFQTYVYDFSGQYIDGGFGGTACENGPCPVDGSAIGTVLFYPNPVDGGFNGEIVVDFVSFGAPLGADEGPAGIPNYVDNFDNNDPLFISDIGGLVSSIADSDWIITGDGTSGAFAPLVYDIHDQVNGTSILGSVVGSGDKIYVKAKASVDGTILRLDLQDEDGFVTSNPSVQGTVGTEYTVLEFDYTGTYTDGGFGGTPCDAGPCPVDGERVNFLQLFIDPGTGAYNGTVNIDWISFGQPIDESPAGVVNYSDDYNVDDLSNISDMSGLSSNIVEGEWTIVGDGSSGQFSPIVYSAHDLATNDSLAINVVGSSNLLYIRTKSTVDGTALRIDLQDNKGFVTSNPSVQQTLTTEYSIYEYDYSNTYTDGGFGGTPCTAGPCPVDGERVTDLQFFIDPGVGGFNGTLSIDWISFGQELMTNVREIPELESLSLFPNPAHHTLGMRFDLAEASQVNVQLYNALGATVYQESLGLQPAGRVFQELQVQDLQAGLYFMQVTINGQTTKAVRIVKK
ncbi:MAG: T9SS type A sorting domain-containing protein [Saprospiraceae bacterium]|nr:T9SS type A sorting domain-containing protein [Saprospiraceae bacterium]